MDMTGLELEGYLHEEWERTRLAGALIYLEDQEGRVYRPTGVYTYDGVLGRETRIEMEIV